MTKTLIDTNIILDIALKRPLFYEDAANIFRKINDGKMQGFISAATVTDIFYILQKESGKEKALLFLTQLLKVIDIVGVDKDIIIAALKSGWNDFEDAVQTFTALDNEIEIIVTRNIKDYKKIKKIKILSPIELINFLD